MDEFEYGFRYFELHAKQRMVTFNFYLVINAFLISSYVSTFKADFGLPEIGYIISLVCMFMSFVFYRLDQRVSNIIKIAEGELRKLELKNQKFPQVFTLDERIKNGSDLKSTISGHLSYSQSFKYIFCTFWFLGLLGLLGKLIL